MYVLLFISLSIDKLILILLFSFCKFALFILIIDYQNIISYFRLFAKIYHYVKN